MTSLQDFLPQAGSSNWRKTRANTTNSEDDQDIIVRHIVIREVWLEKRPWPHAVSWQNLIFSFFIWCHCICLMPREIVYLELYIIYRMLTILNRQSLSKYSFQCVHSLNFNNEAPAFTFLHHKTVPKLICLLLDMWSISS